jgi:ferrous iron transport protein A
MPPVSSTRPLSELNPGESGVIARLKVDESLYQRLTAMGLRIGRPIQVIRHAALSGPIQVRVGLTDLILRRADALNICISPA